MCTAVALPIRIVVAVGMGIGGVYVWVNSKAKKRIAADRGTAARRGRADGPLACASVTRSRLPSASSPRKSPTRSGTEMGVIADEAAYGRDMGESLKAMAERHRHAGSALPRRRGDDPAASGGNLAEILDGLAKVIRSRFKLFRRVKAITAEAKWSGMFLSGFPDRRAGR